LECAVVHIPDVEVDPEYQHHGLTRAIGLRSAVFVPLLRDGAPLGVIMVARAEPGPFPESQIELLKTFAEQAVIAAENVRLFTELQASNRELTTTLEPQTATSEILRVINRSQASVQPVFEAIVGTAGRRLRGYTGALTRLMGDRLELAAFTNLDEAGDAVLKSLFPRSVYSEWPHAHAIRDRIPFNIGDAQTDLRVPEAGRSEARVRGYRSLVVLPMLRHDVVV